MIRIKPHHFIDIVKLYGAGVEHFVPDEAFQHDFYKAANEIVNNLNCTLQLTVGGDDICAHCNRYDGRECTDPLDSIRGYSKKETYNREIDARIIRILNLDLEKTYSAGQLLQMISEEEDLIFRVWLEEEDALTARRNELFRQGCRKLGTGYF